MYKVYCDNTLIYDGIHDDLKIFDPKLTLELNKVGSFTFTVYQNHPMYVRMKKLKSIITVYRDKSLIFRGRILNDKEGWYREKSIECEGELAFLIDTIQRPYTWTGDVAGLFSKFISAHNEQADPDHQFKVGSVTVTDPNNYLPRSDSQYLTTWDSINEKLIKKLGGYLIVRHESDGVYIDYLAELKGLTLQEVSFGKNLIDFEKQIKGDEIITGIIPLGAKLSDDSDERLTIASVNNGKDYILNTEMAEAYGKIFTTQTWDDVTQASNLLTKGQQALNDLIKLSVSLSLTAVDLSNIDKAIDSFKLGTSVKVVSVPHGIDDYYLVTKLTLNLFSPQNDKLTLGATYKTLTEQTGDSTSNIINTVINNVQGDLTEIKGQIGAVDDKVDGVAGDLESTNDKLDDTNAAIIDTETRLTSVIDQTSTAIKTEVSEDYVAKTEFETLKESVSTQFEQTANSFEFTFNELQQQITNVGGEASAEFEIWRKYIRFVDGNIVLGEAGSEVTLQIENDNIAFYVDGSRVAYFADKKLYVYDGEFINMLQIGNFAFIPRKNGNLAFRKVSDG